MKAECRLLSMVLLVIAVFFLSGCSDNDSAGPETSPGVVPAGIWLGYQEVHDASGSQVFDMKTIIYDGSFYGISEGADIMYAGNYAMREGRFLTADGSNGTESSYKMYSINQDGRPFARGITTLNISERKALKGVFENEALQEGEITTYFSALYDKKPSLSYLAGSVAQDPLAAQIDRDGAISGIKGECSLAGAIVVPESASNIYEISYDLSGANCEKKGSYRGLGIIALDETNAAYFLALSRNNEQSRMDRILYYLDQTPVEYLEKSTAPSPEADEGAGDDRANLSAKEILATVGGVNLSGAWAPDGTRCGSISIGECAERTYDSGLSYEEVVQRKQELQGQADAVSSRSRQSAEEGVSFVESVGAQMK